MRVPTGGGSATECCNDWQRSREMSYSARIRSFVFVSLVFFLPLAPVCSPAASPAAGTLTPTSGPLTYSSGPFLQPNPTPIPEYDIGPECNNPIEVCDYYALTVALPVGYAQTYPQAHIQVSLSWAD